MKIKIGRFLRGWAGALALAGAARAAEPVPAAKAPEVKASTAAPVNIATLYNVDRLRDPFQKASASGKAAPRPFTRADFDIHNLSLRGIMQDAGTGYALFGDTVYGVTFVLRKGKLYDDKGKAVPGVTGSLDLRKKTVHLMTREQDVQTFRLGEEEKE